jgi:hypothetical protein
MSITERVNGAQDMKKLHAQLTTARTQKQERHAQMELFQVRIAEVIVREEEAKTYVAQTQAECARLISGEIEVQALDSLKEKTM